MSAGTAVLFLIAGLVIGLVLYIKNGWLVWQAFRKSNKANFEYERLAADNESWKYTKKLLVIAIGLLAYIFIISKLTAWK